MKKDVCPFKDCEYRGTKGCRVKGLGVFVTECEKYKKKEK